MPQPSIEQLKSLEPRHGFFIGIDSDGCVFDTMELKQKECFIPLIVKIFGLQSVSKYVRECGEFVNLYSRWRGLNRYPALLKTLEMAAERPQVRKRGAAFPDLAPLRDWIAEETRLGMPALRQKAAQDAAGLLRRVLEWSEAVDAAVKEMVQGVGPFPGVREVLDKAGQQADLIVVSQTPTEALTREWSEHGVKDKVRLIAGQELGTKAEHLEMAAAGKYAAGRMLVVGDAPGDLAAARKAGALFFPVMPGQEEDSWDRLLNEALDRFFAEQYAGDYEKNLAEAFEAALPATPPWERQEVR